MCIRDRLKEWLKVKPEFDSYEYTRDNLCVLNLRGGEYASEPALFLRKKYWTDAMAQMLSLIHILLPENRRKKETGIIHGDML